MSSKKPMHCGIKKGGCDEPMHRWLVPLVRWSKHSLECKQGGDTGLTMAAPLFEGPRSSGASILSVLKMCLSIWGPKAGPCHEEDEVLEAGAEGLQGFW